MNMRRWMLFISFHLNLTKEAPLGTLGVGVIGKGIFAKKIWGYGILKEKNYRDMGYIGKRYLTIILRNRAEYRLILKSGDIPQD